MGSCGVCMQTVQAERRDPEITRIYCDPGNLALSRESLDEHVRVGTLSRGHTRVHRVIFNVRDPGPSITPKDRARE